MNEGTEIKVRYFCDNLHKCTRKGHCKDTVQHEHTVTDMDECGELHYRKGAYHLCPHLIIRRE